MHAMSNITLTASPAAAAPTPQEAATRHAPRTLALLHAPLLSLLLRLSAPNMLVMLAQGLTGLIETYWISHLGTASLAGMALVFPGFMLMQMMSAGAMGGGIASAIARALGAGRRADADALAVHALAINTLLGLVFTVAGLLAGPTLYRAMGGEGPALAAAIQYSNVVFGGAVLAWLFNGLASCIRGTGNMLTPGLVTCGGVVLLIPLSPCLIFGAGPIPAMGVAGGGLAMLLYYFAGGLAMLLYIHGRRSLLKLRRVPLRLAPLWSILRVGIAASLVTVQTNLVVTLTTASVGAYSAASKGDTYGAAAIAGYGTGSRLEYLLVPLVFGLGSPLVALVGTNLGAGQTARALRAAWTGAILAFLLTETIGLAVATFPEAWLRLFDTDPAMLETGSAYFRAVGPFYGFFGFGMALYFASQGAGRMALPLAAAIIRMLVAVIGGWLALRLTGSLNALFLALGAGLVCLGIGNALAVAAGTWFRPHTNP